MRPLFAVPVSSAGDATMLRFPVSVHSSILAKTCVYARLRDLAFTLLLYLNMIFAWGSKACRQSWSRHTSVRYIAGKLRLPNCVSTLEIVFFGNSFRLKNGGNYRSICRFNARFQRLPQYMEQQRTLSFY